MPSDLILITGATSHVGFKVLLVALEEGYNVRVAVRSVVKAGAILSAESIKTLKPGLRLTFVTVPDITFEGAFDEAVRGVKYVIHVASPLGSADLQPTEFEIEILVPALKGTTGLLRSASRTTGMDRIVITGSNVAIMPTAAVLMGLDDGVTFDEKSVVPPTPSPIGNYIEAYCVSKALAWKATNEFLEKEKPLYDIVTIMPSFVIGGNEMAKDTKVAMTGSNPFVLAQILGISMPFPGAGTTVHIDDVAAVHVKALDSKIPGNTNYLMVSGGVEGNILSDALGIVARNYPQAVASGILPNNGVMKTLRLKVDSSKVEKTFGIKLKDYESQVKNVTEFYLELIGEMIA